jgi:hypothetical protein
MLVNYRKVIKNLPYMFLLVFLSCSKQKTHSLNVPSCVQTKIELIQSLPVDNPPKEVWKWQVDGNTYYYFSAACCDQYSELYDTNCNLVCHPDGGLTGAGDGNCPNFSGSIIKTLIWKDPR